MSFHFQPKHPFIQYEENGRYAIGVSWVKISKSTIQIQDNRR